MEGSGKTTRERVLDVALDLFVEQGYDKASLREIAEQVGFTKAALYYHFASKTDILMALHDRMHRLLEGPMSILGEGPVSMATYEKFLDACIDGMDANRKLFVLHQANQAAFNKVHLEGHEEAHLDIQDRARAVLSDPALSPKVRLRMMAAFAVAFVTPMVASGFLGGGEPAAGRGRQSGAGSSVGPPAPGPVSSSPVPSGDPNFVSDLKDLVRQVLTARDESGDERERAWSG